MLTTSLILSARMGIYQEQIYSKYGSHHREALFFTVSKSGCFTNPFLFYKDRLVSSSINKINLIEEFLYKTEFRQLVVFSIQTLLHN